MAEKLLHLDRRIIFAILFVVVVVSLFWAVELPFEASAQVRTAYSLIQDLPKGSIVMMSFDYGPSTGPEIQPTARAIARQCFKNGLYVIGMCIWNEGEPYIRSTLGPAAEEFGKKEDVDYVNLGYKWGGPTGAGVLEGMGKNIAEVFPATRMGTAFHEVPFLKDVHDYKSIKLIASLSAGKPGLKEYLQMVHSRYNIPILGACSAVTAPEMFPLLNSGQLSGLVAGMIGGSEYLVLMGERESSKTMIFAQSVFHFVILGFIIFGNILYFIARSKKT
ncbi:MAG: hypothetical protein HYU64_17765 [Armatimonadetes bacterium]|nr:hypothetical protein [Armatimonadota bacterium]